VSQKSTDAKESTPYEIYHQQAKQSEAVMAKNVNSALTERLPFKPALDHPWCTSGIFKNRTFLLRQTPDISTLG
jgi:hypothetical protein